MEIGQMWRNGVDICRMCGSDIIICLNSRSREDGRYRARKCTKCGFRFHTIEVLRDSFDELKSRDSGPLKQKIMGILNG